jgi:hypothetical protein
VRMLGFLESVCLGEKVDEREASLEEWDERQAIYAHHVDAQDALVAATLLRLGLLLLK